MVPGAFFAYGSKQAAYNSRISILTLRILISFSLCIIRHFADDYTTIDVVGLAHPLPAFTFLIRNLFNFIRELLCARSGPSLGKLPLFFV